MYWLDYSNVGWSWRYNGNGVNLELFSRFVTTISPATAHLEDSGRRGSDREVRGRRPGGDQLHVPIQELVHLAQVRPGDCLDVGPRKLDFYPRKRFALSFRKMFPSQFLLLLLWNRQSFWKLLKTKTSSN